MSKLTFAVCALFTAILFAFVLCFALIFAKLDRIENSTRMAQNGVVTLSADVQALNSTIMNTDESLESVEYFVYDNGTIKIVRDNGDVVTYCLQNADCDN